MPGGGKGSAFERAFAVRLSLWWTGGRDDDVFWRPGGSGGRAKRRGRAGKSTDGQHGDICATRSSGEPLIRFLTIECKRGYNSHTLVNVLDSTRETVWAGWLAQAQESAEQAGSFSWLIVHKRDRREPLVFFPGRLRMVLKGRGLLDGLPLLAVRANGLSVYGTTLGGFLDAVSPGDVRDLCEWYSRTGRSGKGSSGSG